MKAKVYLLSVALTLGVLALSVVSPAYAQGVVCFPTCDEDDGRFLVIATGAGLETLGGQSLRIKLAVPREQPTALLEFFDGDSGGTDDAGVPHWDVLNSPVTYTLFADPNTDGTELIELASLTSDQLADNEWQGFTIQTDEIAAADSGNFFYQLEVVPSNPDVVAVNALKIRSTGFIYFGVQEQPFAFMATWTNTLTDLPLVYPNYNPDDPLNPNNLVGANYDGSFDFYLDLQLSIGNTSLDDFSMWDGDLDRGDFDGGNPDIDDSNTPNDELPFFDVDQLSVFEGVAVGTDPSTGAPPDNVDPDSTGGFGIYNERAPSVQYSVFSPATEEIAENPNPSGNQEWEHFVLTTDELDPEVHDEQVEALSPGVYSVRLDGMDMNNLNAWFFEGRVLCQLENGEPCLDGPRPYLIGDTVWYDFDESQTQEPDEPGIPGVIMNNLAADGTVLETTLTDPDGIYNFDTWPGDYTVEVDPLNFQPAGPLGAVGDTVWFDANANGIQEPFETGFPSVLVKLLNAGNDGIPYTADDRILDTQLTDSSGMYLFRNLDPGIYYTIVDDATLNDGLRLSGGSDPSAPRTILSDEFFDDLDFGYTLDDAALGALGDRVWADLDSNGQQDPDEPGIGNVTLTLTRLADGLQVDATTTAGGYYLFTELEFGDYEVNVTDTNEKLVGFVETASPGIISVAGINVTGDFGYFSDDLNAVDNVVWFDDNRDGVFDFDETGLANVTIELTDELGDGLASTMTGPDGSFSFDGLADGNYNLVITDLDNVLSGLIPTTVPMLDGGILVTIEGSDVSGIDFGVVDEGALVDFVATTDSPTQSNTVIQSNVLTYDFGYDTDAGLGDFVWLDRNGDGQQDAGEPGIPDVTVTLEGEGLTLETTTDGDGLYFFEVEQGLYTVTVDPTTLPPDLVQTFDLDGILDDETTVELEFFEVRLDVDFGYQPVDGSIGDTIWRDDNGDGIQDVDEPGIPGVTVVLVEDGDVIDSDVTDSDGMYLFDGLASATYRVGVDETTLPDGLIQTGDPDGTLDGESTVDLGSGEENLDQDFGYQPVGTIGDTVWEDLDRDGVEDPGEPGIPGVTVTLEDEAGNVLDTDVTDGNGMYLFEDLPIGVYTVVVDPSTLPNGFEQTGDPDGILDNESSVDLGPGEEDLTLDFGYAEPPVGSLGDRVWFDFDGDGVQDPGEPGINGVTVQLRDSSGQLLEQQSTSGDGSYLFTDLPGDDYTIFVVDSTLPPGLVQTGDPDGTLDDRTDVTLPAGGNNLDNDFGYQPLGSLGDRVWEDLDGDGVQDPGEPGIPGVTVSLKDEDDNVIDTDVTDANGNYLFDELPTGIYSVCIDASTLPDGYIQTGDPDGLLDGETTTTLDPAETDLGLDFGYQPPSGSIGDTIWLDLDGDGVQDPNEPGIPGVTVILKDEAGNVIDTQVTDSEGMYLFEDLPAGTYTICVDETTLPPGLDQTGDPDGTLDNETTIDLDNGEIFLDGDFGYQPTGTIGDTIWLDEDGDGVQDPGEPGIPGVTVLLKDESGDVVDTQVTDADGMYLFENLLGGTYTVCVDTTTLPPGLEQTGDPDGTLDDETTVILQPGEEELDADFGYEPPSGSIGDTIWLDIDGDGVQDPGEPGIPGVTVILKDEAGNIIDTQVTDSEGMYLFEDLPAGTYTICVDETTLPPGLDQTGDPDGTLDGETTIVLDNGDVFLDGDFGYQPLGEICGTVYEDTNGNGIQDPDEPGIPGVPVDLLDDAGNVIDTVITDSEGNYCFTNLPGGNYEVCVNEGGLPDGWEQTADPDAKLDGCTDVDLPPGGQSLDNDFGYQPPPDLGSIGDTIWFDQDGDGVQDPNEPGIPGVTVILKDEAGNVIDTQVTDSEGMYLFEDLPAGTYTICVDPDSLPPGSIPTGDPDGTFDNETTVELDEGEDYLDGDFGYDVPQGCVPGFVLDEFETISYGNNDGSLPWAGPWVEDDPLGAGPFEGSVFVRVEGRLRLSDFPDSGEEPSVYRPVNLGANTAARLSFDWAVNDIADPGDVAVIEISDDDGATWTVLDEFSGIVPDVPVSGFGQYNITDFMATNTLIRFRIAEGFGEFRELLSVDNVRVDCVCDVGSIGDRVWEDTNSDGIQDPGEPGIPGVTVLLKDEAGDVLDTQVTDADGMYLFTDLPPGIYSVCIDPTTLPDGYTQTFDLDGDLDNETTGPLPPGTDLDTVDFGYTPPPTGLICGTIFEDTNGNGIQDPGEPGIPGVPVDLFDDAGNLIDTVITDSEGNYCFEDVPGGDYEVCVNEDNIPLDYEQTADPDALLDGCTDVDLPPGGESLDNDFGYQPPTGEIGDTIWQDNDRDGVQDPGEPGIPGVTVILKDESGNVIATDVTDSEGMYLFEDLPAGTYTICVDETTLPPGFEPTGDPDGDLDNETTIVLDPGEQELDADFGYNAPPLGSICGTVWEDTDGDGQQNNGELGIPDVTVTLKDEFGNVITTTQTDSEGNYCFEDLPAGSYLICVEQPDGTDPTFDPDGTLDNETPVDLDPGENEEDVDFGYQPQPKPCLPTLDFEHDAHGNPLEAGQIIDDEFDGMTITTQDPINHPAMIFDSANPTGGDFDLGTPNEDFGGPGVGDGGGAGEPGENSVPRNNVLIISEDADQTDPDDDGSGGTITFDFDSPVEVSHLGILDIEEEGGTIVAYDVSGNVITTSPIPAIGDNGYVAVLVGASEVASLDVNFVSSGAVAEVIFCADLCIFNWDGIGGRALYMPEISRVLAFEPDPGSWQEEPNGNARITGEVTDQNDFGNQGFLVEFELTGRYTDGNWIYYSDWTGTLTGTGNWEGAVLTTVGVGDHFQAGYGANQKDDDLGISGWFDWTVVSQPDNGPHLPETGKGDINADVASCLAPLDPICSAKSVRDEFSVRAYDNNDGADDWSADWIEDDPEADGAGATKGAVRVDSDALRLDDNEDTGGEPSAARTADLSQASGGVCTLSFGYDTDSGVDESDEVTVEISADGGTTYTTLDLITGIDGATWDHVSLDISDYISSQTTVRYRVSAYYGGEDEHIWIDDVTIDCSCP